MRPVVGVIDRNAECAPLSPDLIGGQSCVREDVSCVKFARQFFSTPPFFSQLCHHPSLHPSPKGGAILVFFFSFAFLQDGSLDGLVSGRVSVIFNYRRVSRDHHDVP